MGAGASLLLGKASKDEKDKKMRKKKKKDKPKKVKEPQKRLADPVRMVRQDKLAATKRLSGLQAPDDVADAPTRDPLSASDEQYWNARFGNLRGVESTVPISKLVLLTEFAGHPLIGRLLSLYDEDSDGQLSLEDFLKALMALRRAQTHQFKAEIAFRVYDVDEDNLVSQEDMLTILQEAVGEEVPRAVLEATVVQTILAHDMDKDGALNFKEFKRLIDESDVDVVFGYWP
mmetsp:Transcript_46232/g.77062  ORF Transcript_46232/g.77062 Transcript_46232/m.77062 type:complete len:231 (-) Transcript_46232:354-1046(-)|eukprot:CAMPEP_0198217250 /NCGR_PEP_ID=MMETSP1445-20131203/62516_1 /TAXON_ID=36898 /ORGANISM="Pyramimonas sp., Strain CCMP2087" /LENGTH=230 /DNA_ID=CAMNT_0043893857 /DNA_START=240 /DNA_END=932 /DNA_ORIENTATION=+